MSMENFFAKFENFILTHYDHITLGWFINVRVASATWCNAERGAVGANAGRERRGRSAPARLLGWRIQHQLHDVLSKQFRLLANRKKKIDSLALTYMYVVRIYVILESRFTSFVFSVYAYRYVQIKYTVVFLVSHTNVIWSKN